MVRPRGKSRSTPSTPTSPAESFIQKKISSLRCGDVKALAASSIAVASSIGSPSLNKPYEQNATPAPTPVHDAINRESSSRWAADPAWQTAYSTAKMVIEITKESSDMFLPLKAVVGALSLLIKNHDRTASNTKQIEDIEERILSFSDILRSPLREDDLPERARRELLCRRLMDILGKLEPLSEQNGLLKFLQNEDHTSLLDGFVQDITHAVTDYQISLQQNTYQNTRDTHEVARNIDQATKGIAEDTAYIAQKTRVFIEAADLELLDKLNPVRNAGYQAEHHDRCLTGTRDFILGDILGWAQSTRDQPVFWLNGLAGTGKSTIAQTFAETAKNHNILGASFFCSRDYLDRKELKNIFPTLAYQLACHYPQFRDHLVKVIKQDPSAAHNSLISQLRDLLVDPLSATDISCVIVIDALDECIDDQPASAILSVLGRLVSKLPMVKFFITGRPEPRIRSGFRLPLLEPFTQIFLLHKVDSESVGGDIRLYLTEKLATISKRRSGLDLAEAWPSDKDITALVEKSSGLFIFASTVVRFIESEHHEPIERLRLITSQADDTSYEGASGTDSLYFQVLRDAFSGINERSVFIDLKRILSAVVLALNPLTRDGLAQLLNINSAVISATLRHLHSVLLVPAEGSKEIRVFHKSFPDFLQDPDRCADPRFYVDSPTRHREMALSCLELVETLTKNPCSLPPFVMNRDIPDLQELMEDKLGSGLRYACEFWAIHLSFSPSFKEYRFRLAAFFGRNLFPWMEVMSLEGHLEGVIHSMNHLLGKVETVDGSFRRLTTDCLRFTLHFFQPIQMSAQHIYHTALPLSPETSVLRSLFFRNHSSWEKDRTTHQVSSSRTPTSWGPILRTIAADSGSFKHMAVAGQRIIAVCEDNRTVNVYDGVTGVLKLSLNTPRAVTKAEGSSDGSLLFFAHQRAREITMWDTQTGGLIHTFTTTFDIGDIGISLNGKHLASCSSDNTFRFWEVESKCGGSRFLDQPVVCIRWVEAEDQIALALEGAIVILELTNGRTLHTIPIEGCVQGMAFSAGKLAVLSAIGTENKIVVIDIRTCLSGESTPLADITCIAFLGKDDRVICATKAGDIRPYRTTFSSDWENHAYHLGTIHSISLLGSGQLVVNSGGSIQLLETEYYRPSATDLDPEIAHVYQLDGGKAVCGSSRDQKHVTLLDIETMETLAKCPVDPDECDGPFVPRFVCASVVWKTAILCFQGPGVFVLKLYDFAQHNYRTTPRWTEHSLRPVLSGAVSPDGTVVIVAKEGEGLDGGGYWELDILEALDGNHLYYSPVIRIYGPPNNIVFTSATRFCIESRRVVSTPLVDVDWHDSESLFAEDDREGHRYVQTNSTPPTTSRRPLSQPWKRVVTTVDPRALESMRTALGKKTISVHNGDYIRETFFLRAGSGARFQVIEKVPGEEILPAQPYALDESLEWVVDAKSRRVCWLPPGYISGIEDGYYFVGSSLIMAGQDGIVRRLTFRNLVPDS